MVDYDPFSEAILDDPFPVYRALRERSPVHYLPKYDCWALSRFDDIWAAGQDPVSFRSPGPNLLSFELPEGCGRISETNPTKNHLASPKSKNPGRKQSL